MCPGGERHVTDGRSHVRDERGQVPGGTDRAFVHAGRVRDGGHTAQGGAGHERRGAGPVPGNSADGPGVGGVVPDARGHGPAGGAAVPDGGNNVPPDRGHVPPEGVIAPGMRGPVTRGTITGSNQRGGAPGTRAERRAPPANAPDPAAGGPGRWLSGTKLSGILQEFSGGLQIRSPRLLKPKHEHDERIAP